MSLPINWLDQVPGLVLGQSTQIAHVIRWFFSYYRNKKPLMRLLDPFAKNDEDCIIVIPKLPLQKDRLKEEFRDYPFLKKIDDKPTPLHFTDELTGTHDPIAISYIHLLLSKAGKKDKLKFKVDEELGEDELNVNLICIGAWSNRITMATIERSPYFKFGADSKGGYILSPKRGNHYYDYESNRSYGILLKLRDVFHSNKAVMVAAGLSADAGAGAAYYLWSKKEYYAKKYSASSFGILVKIDTDLGYGSAEAIEEWSPAK